MKRFKKIGCFLLAGLLLLCSGVYASAQEEATLRVVTGRRERTCKHCEAPETQALPMLPSVSIQNYKPNLVQEYRTTITFTADVSACVDEAEIHWFADGVDVGTGERYTVKKATKSFTIQAKLICDGEHLPNQRHNPSA